MTRAGRVRPTSGARRNARALYWAALAMTSAGVAGVSHATPPAFPDNIVVFPNRDFVTIEGFQDHVGEAATVEVRRAGQLVGSAIGIIEEGDVAFEINHPGGYCWGAGTGLNVTPDIVAGDVVGLRIGGAIVADTIVGDAAVDAAPVLSGSTVTISGHLSGVNPAFLEQRVVNPGLTGTDVARRDIRALPGPLTRAARGGYASQLVVSGSAFTATYVFDTAATAALVAGGGGERLMSWQEQDADGNRQGLTIAEFGEQGGPGFGGCPANPGQLPAPLPGQAAAVRSADRTAIQVTWTAATTAPGGAAVTGYSVVAIGASTSSGGERRQLGTLTGASATASTITGLTAGETYTVEVRTLTGTTMSAPFTIATPSGGTGATTPPNATFPAPTATLGSTGVTFTRPANTEIYYTLDGSEPRVADMPSTTAQLYVSAIAITTPATLLRWVAFDLDGNFSDTGEGVFQPTVVRGPAAPTGVVATAGDGSATVGWVAPTGSPAATSYVITATPRSEGAPSITVEAPAGALSIVISRLVNGIDYDVVVTGVASGVRGTASAALVVRPAVTVDRLAITSARWKQGDFRVVGTGSITGANVTVYTVTASNTPGVAITGATAPVTAPVAPAVLGDFSIRLRTGIPTNPGRIFVRSDRGGLAGPFTVTNN